MNNEHVGKHIEFTESGLGTMPVVPASMDKIGGSNDDDLSELLNEIDVGLASVTPTSPHESTSHTAKTVQLEDVSLVITHLQDIVEEECQPHEWTEVDLTNAERRPDVKLITPRSPLECIDGGGTQSSIANASSSTDSITNGNLASVERDGHAAEANTDHTNNQNFSDHSSAENSCSPASQSLSSESTSSSPKSRQETTSGITNSEDQNFKSKSTTNGENGSDTFVVQSAASSSKQESADDACPLDDSDASDSSHERLGSSSPTTDIYRLRLDKQKMASQLAIVIKERDTYLKDLESKSTDMLVKTIEEQQAQLEELKAKCDLEKAEAKNRGKTMKMELMSQIEQANKACQSERKEKEMMVMKYAKSEKDLLDMGKLRETLENKVRTEQKEKEHLIGKIRNVTMEKMSLAQRFDGKCHEALAARRDIEKQKDESHSVDIKWKWTQNKLRMEVDAHKRCKETLEETLRKLKQAQEETEQIRRNTQEIVKTYQESEEVRSNSLDLKLKEKEKEMARRMHEMERRDEQCMRMNSELEVLSGKFSEANENADSLQEQVASLETEVESKQLEIRRHQENIAIQDSEIHTLKTKLESAEHLQLDLERERKHVAGLQQEAERLRQRDTELQENMDICHRKQAELLDFTEKVTTKNAQLQSEQIALQNKSKQLEMQLEQLSETWEMLQIEKEKLYVTHHEDAEAHKNVREELQAEVDIKTKEVEVLTRQVEDELDEKKILKRRHGAALKDLSRQLQQSRRRVEMLEVSMEPGGERAESTSMGSRTSSQNSLEQHQLQHQQHHQYSEVPVDKQLLIEKIVRLQRALARKNEKVEFLQDHIRQLTNQVQLKTRLIQSYILKEESGGILTSEAMDANKAVVMQKGGIMASVYSSVQADAHMTLELSLEINTKLQSVLEDTLLKNITLKDNIETLGTEIARLSQENRRIKLNHLQQEKRPPQQ